MLNKIFFVTCAVASMLHGVAFGGVSYFDKSVSYGGVKFSGFAFAGDCAEKVSDYSLGEDPDGNPEFVIYFKKGWTLTRGPNETDREQPTEDICQLRYKAKIDSNTTFKFKHTKIAGKYTVYRGHEVRFRSTGALGSTTFDSIEFIMKPKGQKDFKTGVMVNTPLMFVEQGQKYPCGGNNVPGSLTYVMTVGSDGSSKPAKGNSKIQVLSAITKTYSSISMPLTIGEC